MIHHEIVESPIDGRKFLILKECNNTLAAMVMLKQVQIEWLDCNNISMGVVTDPQTIFGGSPNRFGIKI